MLLKNNGHLFYLIICSYDKVAVNLKQFMVLDEISRKVINPYFFGLRAADIDA